MSASKELGTNADNVQENGRLSSEQAQTAKCFDFKWRRRHSYESAQMQAISKKWLTERYCAGDPSKLNEWLGDGRKIILDVGCGSGYSAILFFREYLKEHNYLGIDISSVVNVAKTRFEEQGYSGNFLQAVLMNLPIPENYADMIFSEGVLHHTDSVEKSIKYLTAKLKKGGWILFYVYSKKAVIREFTDDFIRDYLKDLRDEEAWETLKPLTNLGITLGKLNVEIDVPEDIPFLGIKKGKIDIQRFFHWNICKLFYSPDLTLEEINHINFDWFRPLNCHRHTPEEVISFCDDAGLRIERLNIQDPGITVVALKQ